MFKSTNFRLNRLFSMLTVFSVLFSQTPTAQAGEVTTPLTLGLGAAYWQGVYWGSRENKHFDLPRAIGNNERMLADPRLKTKGQKTSLLLADAWHWNAPNYVEVTLEEGKKLLESQKKEYAKLSKHIKFYKTFGLSSMTDEALFFGGFVFPMIAGITLLSPLGGPQTDQGQQACPSASIGGLTNATNCQKARDLPGQAVSQNLKKAVPEVGSAARQSVDVAASKAN